MQFHLFGTSTSELTTKLQDFLERPGIEGFRERAYWDTHDRPNATIGYGFNIQDGRDNLKLVLQELYGLSGQTITQFLNDFDLGIRQLRPPSAAVFLQNQAGFNSQLRSALDRLASQDLGKGPFTINQVQAREVERKILEGYTIDGVATQGVLDKLQRFLSDDKGIFIPSNSNEFVALASLYYNSPALVTSNNDLLDALFLDERAEAWFQIRYKMNRTKVDGVADRRYQESDLFGLYDGAGQPQTVEEAEAILRVIQQNRLKINEYEGRFSAGATPIEFFRQPSLGVLIVAKAQGFSVDDVLLGPGGAPIQGTERNELLLGASGHDILIGGGGDDVLRGEEGQDVYVYNSGDGNDTIVDTDGLGVVVFDHQLLQGGLKKQNESEYKSLDGQVTYQRSGSDLLVNGTLTIKDWQEGQFGIRLKDLPNDPDDPGVGDVGGSGGGGGRTEFLKIDHYIQVGNLPDGTPIFEPVYAPFFDEDGNNSAVGIVPAIDDQPNTISALGGNDSVATGAGDDFVYGDTGNDGFDRIASENLLLC